MRRKKGIVRAVKRQSYEKRRPSRIGQATKTGGREEGNTAAVVARKEWPGKTDAKPRMKLVRMQANLEEAGLKTWEPVSGGIKPKV